jgi:uncharacterized protein YpmB
MNFWKWFRIIGTVLMLAATAAIYYSYSESNQPAANQETSGTIYYTK